MIWAAWTYWTPETYAAVASELRMKMTTIREINNPCPSILLGETHQTHEDAARFLDVEAVCWDDRRQAAAVAVIHGVEHVASLAFKSAKRMRIA